MNRLSDVRSCHLTFARFSPSFFLNKFLCLRPLNVSFKGWFLAISRQLKKIPLNVRFLKITKFSSFLNKHSLTVGRDWQLFERIFFSGPRTVYQLTFLRFIVNFCDFGWEFKTYFVVFYETKELFL